MSGINAGEQKITDSPFNGLCVMLAECSALVNLKRNDYRNKISYDEKIYLAFHMTARSHANEAAEATVKPAVDPSEAYGKRLSANRAVFYGNPEYVGNGVFRTQYRLSKVFQF